MKEPEGSSIPAPPSDTADSVANDSSNHAALDHQADEQESKVSSNRQEGSNYSSEGSGRTNHSGPAAGANASQWSDPTSPTETTDPMSDKDEFFLVDGKSGDFPPPRGDNPVKTEKRIVSDGSIHSGPGLDRDPGNRNQFVPEAVGPGGPLPRETQRRDNRIGIERDSTDSSEEYIVTYQTLRRRFRSWSD